MVVTWNGTPVATSEDLKIDAQLSVPGARIKVALLREGKRIDREVVPRAATKKVGAAVPPVELRAPARRELAPGGDDSRGAAAAARARLRTARRSRHRRQQA